MIRHETIIVAIDACCRRFPRLWWTFAERIIERMGLGVISIMGYWFIVATG